MANKEAGQETTAAAQSGNPVVRIPQGRPSVDPAAQSGNPVVRIPQGRPSAGQKTTTAAVQSGNPVARIPMTGGTSR